MEKIPIPDGMADALLGPQNSNLRVIEGLLGVRLSARGTDLFIEAQGEPDAEAAARAEQRLHTLVDRLAEIARRGHPLRRIDVEVAARLLRDDPDVDLRAYMIDSAIPTPSKKLIYPKSRNQKRYLDAMRTSDLVFGIGPAGTGKTYLAAAAAVQSLVDRRVRRLVLTRPAVEAGEKLGFLPGDLAEKVDPYLRPLYDALYDFMDPDSVRRAIERSMIEVAPIAFMRGRAQPQSASVLTPRGFRSIGSLRPGDPVIGSNGQATRVIGVYPQGRKEVFRVTAQDGASTLCCGEHLWAVHTPEDRRRRRPARVLQTSEMMARLRRAHQRRYELPLLSGPASLTLRDVPMDPYALGLLLGDGCLTGSTTPSFSTADLELVRALQGALTNIELVAKSRIDYTLRQAAGGRGGLRIPNPVTVTLRDLGLCGARSDAKFVPRAYIENAPAVRLAVLQGLLDTDGGPVTQRTRTCRIQYATTSPQLRDDVVFLVRSLGGVAYARKRRAEGRAPGRANGRPVMHRADAYVIDIRLPAGIAPFRLERKRDRFEATGNGRPMRHLERIEPAGVEECVCIRVAAGDALYVTDDFLVTHNTLNDAFVILDEAQNTTSEQMKMLLTRIGFGSRVVVTGDVTQIDLAAPKVSGLKEIQTVLAGIDGIQIVLFDESDVVRHPLVQKIVRAYETHEHATGRRSRGEPPAPRSAEGPP